LIGLRRMEALKTLKAMEVLKALNY